MSRPGPTISAAIPVTTSRRTRTAITALSAAGGTAAALVGAVSLTRIAAEHLGFPPLLTWTLTAAVDIGAVAGAVMWSTSSPKTSIRRTGVRLNVSCSLISAFGVGLDHAVHASSSQAWKVTAFVIGAFLPLLSTWLVHALAKVVAVNGEGEVDTPRQHRSELIETPVEIEPEFQEPTPVVRRVTAPPTAIPADVQVDAETVAEIDEIEIHRVMRDTKPRVSREVAT